MSKHSLADIFEVDLNACWEVQILQGLKSPHDHIQHYLHFPIFTIKSAST